MIPTCVFIAFSDLLPLFRLESDSMVCSEIFCGIYISLCESEAIEHKSLSCHMGISVNVVHIMFEEVKTIPLEKNIIDDDESLLQLQLLCYILVC